MASHGKDWPEFPGFCRNSYYEPGFRNPALFYWYRYGYARKKDRRPKKQFLGRRSFSFNNVSLSRNYFTSPFVIAACGAASLAIGTRKGEQDT